MTELHCLISGRVQGVAYRAFAESVARELGLKGFVTNLPDGSVEVVAQGEYGVLKVFSNHLRTGPPHAQVTGFQEEWVKDSTTTFENFQAV